MYDDSEAYVCVRLRASEKQVIKSSKRLETFSATYSVAGRNKKNVIRGSNLLHIFREYYFSRGMSTAALGVAIFPTLDTGIFLVSLVLGRGRAGCVAADLIYLRRCRKLYCCAVGGGGCWGVSQVPPPGEAGLRRRRKVVTRRGHADR
jgi:hypothetical protein